MSTSGRGVQTTPSRRVDVDLGKLHATRKYDRLALQAKVPWYRNTFDNAEAAPTTPLPPEPVALDAPLVIPQELRPLSHRRRYLRTIQLIDDPIPEVPLAPRIVQDAPPCEKPAVVVPSLKRAKSGLSVKLSGSVSFPVLVATTPSSCSPPPRHSHHRKDPRGMGNLVEGDEDDGDNDDDSSNDEQRRPDSVPFRSGSKRAEMQRRRETTLCATKSMGQLTPLQQLPTSSHSPLSRRRDRERSRRVSVEEAQDLGNSECYFGPTAKTQFFETYRQLCAKPYLFVEDPTLVSPRHVRDHDGYLDMSAGTQSKFMAAFPSSSYLKGVERELAAVGTGVEHSESHLPSDDKLSPRSQFLTAAVTRPYMASAFMLRTAMTKVYDFSFQSLGDECIIEFAKCLRNELPFVEEINVRDNRLSDDGLDALLSAIARGSAMLHLHRLDISQNTVGAKSALTLRSFVATSHCSLRALLVENADIDDNECAAFMTAFEKNLSIQELWMSRNGIGKSEHLNVVQPHFVTGGEAIASMLHRNLVLVHLELAWNYLRLESSITLAKSMFENRTLVQLNVAYNACGDAGAMAFGEALHVNQSLEVLDLSYNSIGCKGAQVLAQALRGNRTLRSLVLDGNCIGREGGQQLMFALCENQNAMGCDISLHACNLTSSVSQPTAPIAMSTSSQTTPSSLASTMRGPPPPAPVVSPNDINLAAMPAYGASSSSVFSAKEPTGRYTLHLKDPYDKMMALELLRLAALKKGCRFVRLDHRATPSAAKKAIQLVRKERKPSVATNTKPSQCSESSSSGSSATADEDPLETLGLDALFTDVMDRDHSGSVDRREVMSVLNRIGLFPKVEHLDNMLAKCDFTQSGAIERGHEFSAFLFHAVFQLIDSDASGKIDADEVEDAFKMLGIDAYDEKEILEAIAMYDISGDGEMEESEFVAFMKDKLLDQIKTQLLVSPSSGVSLDDDHVEPAVAAVLVETTTQKPWCVPDDGVLEVDFLYERQAFVSTEEAHRYAKMPQASIEKLIHNIIDLADSKSEQEDLFHVAVHDSDLKFTASQAYQLLDACGLLKPVERKIESIARMLPQMLTAKESQVLVSRTLTLRQRCRLKAEMGSAYSVAMGNPTAHYSLDLSKPKDRATMAKIAEVAQSEKLFSKLKSGRSDTSQHGNWENFRNEELDGEKCVLTTAFFHVMPVRGKLSFDYVSTARPKKGTAPLSDRRFAQLIAELQTSLQIPTAAASGDTSRSTEPPPELLLAADDASAARKKSDDALKATASAATIGNLRPLPFSKVLSVRTKQTEFWDKTRNSVLQKAAWQFAATATTTAPSSSNDDDANWTVATSRTATKETVALKLVQIESSVCDRWLSCGQAAEIIACMPPQFFARPETARILFARLIDIGNFVQIFDSLVPEDQYVCAKSLGWLNIFNPMAPERHYSLDVSICDEREMTKLLVQLAIAEPGENWINQSFSMVRGEPGIPGWKLPVRWEKEDEKDGGGVNRSGYLEVEYYSGGDRGCAPVPAFRKSLLTGVLAGTRLFCL